MCVEQTAGRIAQFQRARGQDLRAGQRRHLHAHRHGRRVVRVGVDAQRRARAAVDRHVHQRRVVLVFVRAHHRDLGAVVVVEARRVADAQRERHVLRAALLQPELVAGVDVVRRDGNLQRLSRLDAWERPPRTVAGTDRVAREQLHAMRALVRRPQLRDPHRAVRAGQRRAAHRDGYEHALVIEVHRTVGRVEEVIRVRRGGGVAGHVDLQRCRTGRMRRRAHDDARPIGGNDMPARRAEQDLRIPVTGQRIAVVDVVKRHRDLHEVASADRAELRRETDDLHLRGGDAEGKEEDECQSHRGWTGEERSSGARPITAAATASPPRTAARTPSACR